MNTWWMGTERNELNYIRPVWPGEKQGKAEFWNKTKEYKYYSSSVEYLKRGIVWNPRKRDPCDTSLSFGSKRFL